MSRSRHSVRSLKRQAPTPHGVPPQDLVRDLPPASIALLTARNIIPGDNEVEVDIEPLPPNVRPTAPPPSPPEDDPRRPGRLVRNSPSPLDNVDAEPVQPFRKHGRRSPKYNNTSPGSYNPVPAASLLSDENYSYPPASERRPSRNYHKNKKQNDTRSQSNTPRTNSPALHKKITPKPSNSNNNLASAIDDDLTDPGTMSGSLISSDDDMMIMRPSHTPNRLHSGYNTPKPDNRRQVSSNFDPGLDASPYDRKAVEPSTDSDYEESVPMLN